MRGVQLQIIGAIESIKRYLEDNPEMFEAIPAKQMKVFNELVVNK